MDNSSTTTATLDQADEEILTVSDEALEAAAGTAGDKARDSASWGVPFPLC
jgi:hypothetical protein